GPDVVLAEDPFDGHHVGTIGVEPFLHRIADPQQPLRHLGLDRRSHHVHGYARDRPPDPSVHDTEAASGQPGVHTQHTHEASPFPRTPVRYGRLPLPYAP